jgi:DNA-binding transcriptional MocR family regulator
MADHRGSACEAVTERTGSSSSTIRTTPPPAPFDAEELRLVADLCLRHDLVALSDEVWEHVIFDGKAASAFVALAGNVGANGEGRFCRQDFLPYRLEVGWVIAPPSLSVPISKAHQYVTYATPPNLQAAVAYGLGKAEGYFQSMRANMQRARDSMLAALDKGGFVTLPAEGTYFLSIDLAASGIRAGRRDVLRARRSRGGRRGDSRLSILRRASRWTMSSASASRSSRKPYPRAWNG